jgi:hypothetical protein
VSVSVDTSALAKVDEKWTRNREVFFKPAEIIATQPPAADFRNTTNYGIWSH